MNSINYKLTLQELLNHYTKNELSIFNSIKCLNQLQLSSNGHNDTEGYQIFTPKFIVEEMCEAVGSDIFDFSKNVLEPTSGDGAFTVYIFLKRLEKAAMTDNFELNSLKALSTIYSIEMDGDLIERQRNNIFTTANMFIKEHNLAVSDDYFNILRCIITKNFLWAMFNESPDPQSMAPLYGESDIAFAMPNAKKNKKKNNYLLMPVWEISENEINVHEEGVDL